MPTPTRPRRLLWGLLAVLAAWGVYLAIGATGIFTDVGLFDARRSVIVLACSAAFLGFWSWLLLRGRAPGTAARAPDRNWPSLLSVLVSGMAYLLWAAAWGVWNAGNPANLTFVLGWSAVGVFAAAAVLALVGLSDPRRERGRRWGLLTLVLLLLASAAFILQVRHHAQSQRRPALLRPALIRPLGTFSQGEKGDVRTSPALRSCGF